MRGSAVAPWKVAATENEEAFAGFDAALDEEGVFDDPEAPDEDDLDDDDLDDDDDDDDDDDLIDLDDEYDETDEGEKPHPGRFEE